MKYFEIFGLEAEPFSNSPDPDFFFRARRHMECLHKLEIALRLRRGLNVVLGEIGAGKSTICRQLLQTFADSDEIVPRLILDPYFNSPSEFLFVLHELFCGEPAPPESSDWEIKEALKNSLYRLGVDQGKVVTLIIDEGQKMHEDCLEILRELLNYETNKNKLLQIVIFAQSEFEWTMNKFPNLVDRVNEIYTVTPLTFRETVSMIRHRLKIASHEKQQPKKIFSPLAYLAIYKVTGGSPRKIVTLCHKVLLTLIIHKRKKATWSLVMQCAHDRAPVPAASPLLSPLFGAIVALVLIGIAGYGAYHFNLFGLQPSQTTGPVLQPETALESPAAPPAPAAETATEETESKQPLSPSDESSMAEAPTTQGQEPNATATASAESATQQVASGSVAPGPSETDQQSVQADAAVKPQAAKSDATKTSTSAASGSAPSTKRTIAHTGPYPEHLGKLRMTRNDYLSNMLLKVYGAYREYYLPIVARANPALENLDAIPDATAIVLPSIAATLPGGKPTLSYIRVGEKQNLMDAYAASVALSDASVDIRILPQWTPDSGLQFPLVLSPGFPNKAAARIALKTLPQSIQDNAAIVSSWPEDTVFFSNVDFLLHKKQ